MKIYLSVDLEGIGGVVRPEQVKPGAPEYARTCEWATAEVLAVIEGARRSASATEFWVKDAHASGINLRWERFPAGVRWVAGRSRPTRFPGLDETFAALFLIGYHAMNGTPNATLAHTWEEGTYFYLNSEEVGEIAVDAAIAGTFGVPCALVTGDNCATDEARNLLGSVKTVAVKEALTIEGAICYPPDEVREALFLGGGAAVENCRAGKYAPWKPAPPYHFRTAHADRHGNLDSMEAEGDDLRAIFQQTLGEG